MLQNTNPVKDEIDLGEVFAALVAHKIIIFLFVSLSFLLALNLIFNSEKKFTANAIFQIEQESKPGFSFPSELGALASLAGLGGTSAQNSSPALLERTKGREFILEINQRLSLYEDFYFNDYDPSPKERSWKDLINDALGWEKTVAERNAIIENNIILNFRKNVDFKRTEGGAYIISVTHIDPNKAADYANSFMHQLQRLVEDENNAAQELRLSYLSETLADALQDMEETQKKLKDFALQNSALAEENFLSGSLKLNSLRMERGKVQEITKLLSLIENIVKDGNADSSSYLALQSNHPLVDDVDFRRILGMSETISAWTWPDLDTIKAVDSTLTDRIKRLSIEIKSIEENAKIYAASAEALSKFTRDAKIAEATYTVLIEQVKSQTLAAGFQPETFKVFEYATPPLQPSSPNRVRIIALYIFLGVFTGFAFAIVNATRNNVYYTKKALISDVNAGLSVKNKSVRRLLKKPVSEIISLLSKRRVPILDEADIKLSNKKLIYVFNSGGRANATDIARLLALKSAQSGRKVLLCNVSDKPEKKIDNKSMKNISGLQIMSINENMHVLTDNNGVSFFSSTHFHPKIKDLQTHFDQVFISTNNADANIGLIAMKSINLCYVLIAGLRTTRKLDIRNIILGQPIDLLIYD